jgi:hypothetical protein
MLKVAGIILTEASLSIGLNFYNSFLLRNVPGFKFPVIYTAVHMVTSFLGSTVLIVFFGAATVSFAQMRESLLRIALLALLRVASITTNNWSLEYIDLTLNKVIKASAPVFTVALSVLWERKVYSARKIAALGVLALGTMLSCLSRDASAESFTGVVLALVSAAVGGSSLVVSAMLLGRGSGAPRRLTPAPRCRRAQASAPSRCSSTSRRSRRRCSARSSRSPSSPSSSSGRRARTSARRSGTSSSARCSRSASTSWASSS